VWVFRIRSFKLNLPSAVPTRWHDDFAYIVYFTGLKAQRKRNKVKLGH
jgi:hypothetical protein